jgi:CHAT domain-containing protein
MAWLLLNTGLLYAAQGDQAQALDHYQRGRAQFEAAGDQVGVATALLNLSLLHQAQGSYQAALALADQAAALAKQHHSPETFWQARFRAGKSYHRLNQLLQARRAFEEAITVIETRRPQAAEPEQQRFFESRLAPYLAMVDLTIAQEQAGEALAYAERAKAQALSSLLRGFKTQITKTMTPVEQEREQKLLTALVALATQLGRERERQPPNQARLADLVARWQKTQLEYEAFEKRLYAAHPELKALRGEAPPVRLEQAGALITDTKSALLEYVETGENLYLFVLTKGARARGSKPGSQAQRTSLPPPALTVYVLNTTREQLAERVARLQQLIAQRDEGFQAVARELYDWLLKPAQEQLAGKTQLVMMPDGILWDVPFQALQPAEGHYLLEDYALSSAPSLSALRAMRERRRPRPRRSAAPLTLLAFANPAVPAEAAERLKLILSQLQLQPLPETENEVEAIAKLYRAGQSKVYLGAEASEERAKAEAGKYGVLHLAVRGTLAPASPMYSHLLLSPAGPGGKEDGLLEAWEMLKWDLKPALAVLPACERAGGRAGAASSLTGLNWALFVAGCPTAVISQWPVESASRTALMVEFHRALKARFQNPASAMSAAQAWREAAMKLWQSGEHRHPFYWAGFWILGDGS